MKRIRIWDLPTRVGHWLLALLVGAALISGEVGGSAIDVHARLGVAIVGLIAFRLTWGFVGSTHARFASFLPTPAKIRAYLRGEWRGLGHNPLGALSVFALLALIALQFASGLFANDDIAFNGPLSALVAKALSDRLTALHRITGTLLIALVALHLAAIAFHAHVKKDNLVKPMITGWKEIDNGRPDDAGETPPPRGGGTLALIVALIIAAGAVYAASGAWMTPPAAAPAAAPAANW